MEQANTVASQLQQSCAAGQALGPKLESSVAAAEVELGNLEAAQTGPNRPADTAAVKSIVLAAASTADAAGKNVARARTIAQQQSDAACKLAVRISTATADGRIDINKELQNTQFAAQQTDAALQMARGELTRAKGAEQRAQTALAGLTPHASGGDALRGHLGEMLASAKELANFAASLSDGRKARLAPLVDDARPIFKEAGERIDAGATGEELEILKQVRQAYLPIADADEALARCANVMAATATAVQSRLSSLSDRTAKLATVNTAPAASNRDMAAIRDAAADATASVETAEVFLAPIEGLNNEAQNCLTRARNGGNRILAVRNEASLICTKSYPGSVVTSIKNGEPQCGCPSGWSWNLADNACVTDQVRRTEEQRVCSNLPGSVFDSIDPADKRAICACPDGLDWNDQRTACVRVVAGGEPNANETPPDPADAFGNALANIITKLAQAQTNNASGGGDNGGGQTIAPNTYDTQPGSSGSSPARGDANDWGVYRIGPVNQSPEVVHGSKAAILARAGGSFVGLGLSSEPAGTLVARGEWKIEEASRASSYEEAHQQYQALYSKATPSQYWGPFIRINDNLINKYNNPQPFGAPR